MKKFVKFLYIVPLLLLSGFFLWGCSCNSERLISISLSINNENVSYANGEYNIIFTEDPIKIDLETNPSTYSNYDFNWTSDKENIVRVSKNGYLTCVGGEGKAVISVSYNNSSTDKVSTSIVVNVSKEVLPSFPENNTTILYTGENVANEYKVNNPNEEKYAYEYSTTSGQRVNEIVNVGSYIIRYYDKTGESSFSISMRLTIEPRDLTISVDGQNFSSYFGMPLSDGIYYDSEVNDELILQNGKIINSGVGADAGKEIGKYVFTTNARNNKVGNNYSVNVKAILYDEYSSNYEIKYIASLYKVLPRKVVIVLNDQEIQYGDELISNYFFIYDYDDYVANDYSISGLNKLESSSELNYLEGFSSLSYVFLDNPSKNEYGEYDVGNYKISYDANSIPQLNITLGSMDNVIISGNLVINKKQLEVVIQDNSKYYGDMDPKINYTLSGVSSNIDEIEEFLYIDYNSLTDLGENNFKAPVGQYSYRINDSANPNFSLTLQEGQTGKVFQVLPCQIKVKFKDLVDNYSYINDVTKIATYFEGQDYNYLLSFSSLKINDVEQVVGDSLPSGLVGSDGYLTMNTGEKIKINLNFIKVDNAKYFATYQVLYLDNEVINGDANNFSISVLSSSIFLKRVLVRVIPNYTQEIASKEYDKSVNDFTSMQTFFNSFILSDESITDISTIIDGNLLTLEFDDKYVVLKDDNTQEIRDEFKDCGKYKLFLSDVISYKAGMEFYEFVLDDSKDYFFTITPKQVTVIPDENQSKIYGSLDGVLTYTLDYEITEQEAELIKEGALSRQAGENVTLSGENGYKITLGSLSYGENYSLTIADEYFKITPREVVISPNTYEITYGDTFPNAIDYVKTIVGTYEQSLITDLAFEGEFALSYNGVQVNKIDGFYPVILDEFGQIDSYDIIQGSFTCSSSNYTVSFLPGSTYTVNKKQVFVNISPENKESGFVLPSGEIELQSNKFEILGLVSNSIAPTSSITVLNAQLDDSSSYYYISSIDDLRISISIGGNNVTDSYEFNLQNNVLYYINQTIFKLQIMTNEGQTSLSLVYDGENHRNNFSLVCLEDGYRVSEESKYSLSYVTSTGDTTDPINVESYIVTLVLNEGDSLIIENELNPQDRKVFTKLDENQNNALLSLWQVGSLTITRAEIQVNEDLLAFDGSIIYGSSEDDIPNILTEKDGVPIFTDVKGNKLTLENFGEDGNLKNFKFVSSSAPIESLECNENHEIMISVQSTDNVNYKPLTVSVNLVVIQKPIEIIGTPEIMVNNTSQAQQSEDLYYTGLTKRFSLNMQTTNNLTYFTSRFSNYMLETYYDNELEGYLEKYVMQDGIIQKQIDGEGNPVKVKLNEINITENSNVYIDYISGTNYVCLDNGESDISYFKFTEEYPINAGIYLTIATCNSDKNYIFKYTNEENQTQISFFKFYEIKKSTAISIDNWKDSFYYGTNFNLLNVSNLPFEFEIYPSFLRDSLVYQIDNIQDWEDDNYILKVGEYSINLYINEQNYYMQEISQTFNVINCEAVINFPNNNKFVYVGEDTPITSFLKEISATLKDKDGNITEKINYDEKVINQPFTFNYLDINTGKELESAPYDIGKYRLTVTYQSDTHKGTGIFDYEIIKKAFNGDISATNRTLNYDTTYSAQTLYDVMLSMLSVDTTIGYSVVIKNGDNLSQIYSPNDNSWVKSFVNCSKSNKVRFVVSFNDGVTADKEIEALMSFNKATISNNNLLKNYTTTNFYYNGYPVYNELVYLNETLNKKISLAPKDISSTQQEETIVVNQFTYKIIYKQDNIIEFKDGFDNAIFTLQYSYQAYNGSSYVKETYPVDPNAYDYKVTYLFSSIGSNYNLTASFEEQSYRINKIDTLFITFRQVYEETYTGESFINDFKVGEDILISDEGGISNTTMKVTIKNNPSLTENIVYNKKDGIYLVLKTVRDGQIYDLLDSGVYEIQLSLLRNSGYDLSKYFNNISINGVKNSVEEYKKDENVSDQHSYLIRAVTDFAIYKEKCNYTINNIEEIITFDSSCVINIKEQHISVNSNSTFVNNSDLYNVAFYQLQNGTYIRLDEISSFGDLVFEQDETQKTIYIKLEPNNPNYEESGYIRVVVTKV